MSNLNQQIQEEGVTPQPGERLRRAREERELSVADVAVRLKLSVEKINALERGDVNDIATPVFVAGYIRTYARLLELSEDEALGDFAELLLTPVPEMDSTLTVADESLGKVASEMPSQFSLREKSSENHLLTAVFAGLLIVGAVYFLWPSSEVTHKHKDTAAVASSAAGIDGAVTAPEEIVSTTDVAVEESMANAQIVGNQNSAAELSATTELNEEPMPDTSNAAEATVAADAKSELVLNFISDSWAEVEDARGQRLIYRLGKSGSKRAVTGLAPFMVQLGFVQGVDILYNGAVYDLSKYANRRSVRLRIGKAGDHADGDKANTINDD